MPRLVEVPGYVRFWTASAVSAFGSQVTGLALQILTAVTLSASATEVGIVNAARWVPYLRPHRARTVTAAVTDAVTHEL